MTDGPPAPVPGLRAAKAFLASRCALDYTGLWAILREVTELPGVDDDAVAKATTLRAIADLLGSGAVQVGTLVTGAPLRFQPWDLTVGEALVRIDIEWTDLGRAPTIGEVAWFVTTPAGDRVFSTPEGPGGVADDATADLSWLKAGLAAQCADDYVGLREVRTSVRGVPGGDQEGTARALILAVVADLLGSGLVQVGEFPTGIQFVPWQLGVEDAVTTIDETWDVPSHLPSLREAAFATTPAGDHLFSR